MCPSLLRAIYLTCSIAYSALGGASDPPNQPALNASAADFQAFRSQLLAEYKHILSSSGWTASETKDGVNGSNLKESSQGCPWVRASALLQNCSVQQSARFIMTDKSYQSKWDSTYVPNVPLATFNLSNGKQELAWHIEKDSAFLQKRVYYMYSSWQWDSSNSIELISNSIHAEVPAPTGATSGVRSTQWMWRRLTAVDSVTTLYEVLYLSDLKGLVPCSLTVSGQIGSIRGEVNVFRQLIPQMPSADKSFFV